MELNEVNRLHEIGVYTDEMYNKIMNSMSDCGTGQLIGFVPTMADIIYSLKFDPDNFNLIEVVKESTPWLGADNDYPELFGKYGYTYCGICDGFRWKDSINEATELELWMMLALSERYWGNRYRELFHKEEKKKEPSRDFTIDEVLLKEEKYVVIKDTNGHVYGINLNGHTIE